MLIILLAVILGGAILWILLNLKFKHGPVSTIPGPPPLINADAGHLNEIRKTGGLHLYLKHVHEKYGPVVTFNIMGTNLVSIASVESFKRVQHLFDRPAALFRNHRDAIGSGSIQFANGHEGQERHKKLSRPFSFTGCMKYYEDLTKIAMELVGKIRALSPDSHIPIQQHMNMFALRSIVATAFGQTLSEESALKFNNHYDIIFQDNEKFFFEQHEEAEQNCDEVEAAISKSKQFVRDLLKHRLETRRNDSRELFVDLVLDYGWDNEMEVDNAITFLLGGFHTTGNLLIWMMYFMAKHQHVQDRVHAEIMSVLGTNDSVTHETLPKLVYMRQVIDETLRTVAMAPYAARCSDKDLRIGNYVIPANTPILLALGVIQTSNEYWTTPEKFDPDRLTPENSSSSNLVFSPFGFAGKRICPGYRLTHMETAIAVSLLLREFSFELVEGQDINYVHGIVTKPSSVIWLTAKKRNRTENQQ